MPPNVKCITPSNTKNAENQAKAKLLIENLAFIGDGHGCKGFTLFTKFEERHKLISALKKKQGRVVPFKFVKHGVDAWRQ